MMKNRATSILKLTAIVVSSILVSCSSSPGSETKKNDFAFTDSAKSDTANKITPSSAAIKDLPSLFSTLPTLSFPFYVNMDSLKNNKGIEIVVTQNAPWFADFLDYREGTTASAIGKFSPDANTDAILFRVYTPNDHEDGSKDEELVLSLYNNKTGDINSRFLAVASEVYGNAILTSASHGKSFICEQMEGIVLTFDQFDFKDGEIVRGESEQLTFSGDNAGNKKRDAAILSWSKNLK